MEVSSLKLETLTLKVAASKHFAAPSWAVRRGTSCENGVAVHVIKAGEVLDTLKLDDGRLYTLFGRFPSCSDGDGVAVRLEHPSISRVHAAVVCGENASIYVIDLGSSHGTFVSGKRCKPFEATRLQDRSKLSFGQSTRCYIIRVFPRTRNCECDEEMNTLMNCQVEYKQSTAVFSRSSSLEEPVPPKLERRVSFSNLAPEIIPLRSTSAPLEGSSTPQSFFGGSPEVTMFRKSYGKSVSPRALSPPNVLAVQSGSSDDEDEELCSSLDSSSENPLMELMSGMRTGRAMYPAPRRTFAECDPFGQIEFMASPKRVRPEEM